MNQDELLKQGEQEKIISFNNDKTKAYKTEEIVQTNAYLRLIFEYNKEAGLDFIGQELAKFINNSKV